MSTDNDSAKEAAARLDGTFEPPAFVEQKVDLGSPSVGITWPAGGKPVLAQNGEGRWLAQVHFDNGHIERLPGTHPSELDARQTVEAWIAEKLPRMSDPSGTRENSPAGGQGALDGKADGH